MNFNRTIKARLAKDLLTKIVLLGGPRQVGKTTLAKTFIKTKQQYLSWDDLDDRAVIKSHQINPDLKIVVLDEIHKYARWRTLIKGLFDKYEDKLKIIVTGSAKLDHFRKGGDSLFGRFFYHRLHPITLTEATENKSARITIADLITFGGFPEPLLKKDQTFLKRWRRERLSRVVYQDINDLNLVKDISLIEILVDLLPSKVGSPLSIKSLQEDLEVSPNTVSKWITILEQVYYCYRILPYGTKKVRAVKKTNKLYLWDWSELSETGARFENFVASHLLKYCHYLEDSAGHKMELRYLKDIDGREVDFVILKDSKPLFAVECKTGENSLSPHIKYFRTRTTIPKFYQVHLGKKKYVDRNCYVLPFIDFCKVENIP